MEWLLGVALIPLLFMAGKRSESGRQNLVSVFGGTERDALREATAWARVLVAERGLDVADTPILVMRELRRERRALSLLGAKTIVDTMTAGTA
ncbi:hypothetical protein FK268_16400 [Tsukamurella sputi]|uniref:Uncharacterized protein n=1 Tax=Tsukamurella sputi TaxID=2591848 RepID=A0A5C5RLL0_9ACTN|nr:hypothetical protein [Tsukamurella sputi]TWS22975.1 hypothetical protein FK268_16400 [Tsukamurella sputi]